MHLSAHCAGARARLALIKTTLNIHYTGGTLQAKGVEFGF
jgi:hypothetical protein